MTEELQAEFNARLCTCRVLALINSCKFYPITFIYSCWLSVRGSNMYYNSPVAAVNDADNKSLFCKWNEI